MHLCMASSIRAMPEKEKPPAMRVDLYYNKIMLRHNAKAKLIAGTFFRNAPVFTLASGIKAVFAPFFT